MFVNFKTRISHAVYSIIKFALHHGLLEITVFVLNIGVTCVFQRPNWRATRVQTPRRVGNVSVRPVSVRGARLT